MTKYQITRKIDVDVKYLYAECGVRYWEDAEVNGVPDEDGNLIPCRIKDTWCPLIDIETGVILGWPEGTTADIHYKVCDEGVYTLLDANRAEIMSRDGYVPDMLCPGDNGYGDYVIMSVGPDGRIKDWDADLSYFDLDEG